MNEAHKRGKKKNRATRLAKKIHSLTYLPEEKRTGDYKFLMGIKKDRLAQLKKELA